MEHLCVDSIFQWSIYGSYYILMELFVLIVYANGTFMLMVYSNGTFVLIVYSNGTCVHVDSILRWNIYVASAF